MVKNIEVNNHSCLPSSDPLSVPSLMVRGATNSLVEYQVQAKDEITHSLMTGYEVTRFGVPMIGQYVNTGRGRRITISPAVPGAQYRITAWALYFGDGRRSATPAVEYVTPGKASKCGNMHVLYARMQPIPFCWGIRDACIIIGCKC